MEAYIIAFGAIYLFITTLLFAKNYSLMTDARDAFNGFRYDYDPDFFPYVNKHKDAAGKDMMHHRSLAMRAPLWPLAPFLMVKGVILDMKDVENVMIEHESKKVRAAVKRERQKALDEFSNIV